MINAQSCADKSDERGVNNKKSLFAGKDIPKKHDQNDHRRCDRTTLARNE